MLEVLFFILKLLGIIVVSLIGLLLLILFLVLFMPIKYKVTGSKIQESIFLQAYVTYLNPIFRANIVISEQNKIDIRVLFFTVYPRKSKHDNKDMDSEDKGRDVDASKERKTTQKSERKNSTFSKIYEYLIISCDYKEQLIEVLKIILKAIISVLPKECNAEIKFGTGQADTTGYICAFYYAIEEMLPKQFRILYEPVWLEKCLEGKIFLLGKIRLIFILTAIVKIISNKEVRRFYKLIRSV